MRLIAGLDVGTTGCKVTVFTAEGENLGREYRDYPVRRAVDAQEADAVALGESVLDCVRAAKARFGQIEAIGVTSFGEAFVLADEEGKPLRPIILCTDPRGAEECQELCDKVGEKRIASIIGVKPHSMYSLPKLLWIRNHEPEVFAKARSAMLIEDYVIYLLTGECKTDYSCATRAMAFDIRTLDWSDEILKADSFGTAHGIYREKPKLDFDRIRKIRELTDIPLVMHGGSGVSPEDYRTSISCGIRKINYYSYMARAGKNAVAEKLANEDVTFFHVLAKAATEAMTEDVIKAIRVFSER